MRFWITITLFSSLLLSGCYQSMPVNTLNLSQLKQLSRNTVVKTNGGINDIRYAGLREAALSIGARAGLAWRSQQIDLMLDKEQQTLDRAFNFNGLLLAHNVIPPVLEEGRHSLNLANDETIRLSDRTYRIVQQARFVTAAPTWRDYIWMDFSRPEPPDSSLLPRNPSENNVWRHYVEEGWYQGIAQANTIYTSNLNRLQRDYKGMLLYSKLLEQNMVSMPFVAESKMGITNKDGVLRINDKVLRITALPQLQANSKTWNPVIVKPWQKHDESQAIARLQQQQQHYVK